MSQNRVFNKNSSNKTEEVKTEEVKKVKVTEPHTRKDNKGKIITDKYGNPTFF